MSERHLSEAPRRSPAPPASPPAPLSSLAWGRRGPAPSCASAGCPPTCPAMGPWPSRKARCSRRACACTALAWLAVPFIPLLKRSPPLDFDQHDHHYIYYYNQYTPEGLRHTHSVTLVGTTTSASRTKAVIFNSRRFQTDLFNCPHNLHPSRW